MLRTLLEVKAKGYSHFTYAFGVQQRLASKTIKQLDAVMQSGYNDYNGRTMSEFKKLVDELTNELPKLLTTPTPNEEAQDVQIREVLHSHAEEILIISQQLLEDDEIFAPEKETSI